MYSKYYDINTYIYIYIYIYMPHVTTPIYTDSICVIIMMREEVLPKLLIKPSFDKVVNLHAFI